MPLRHIDRVAGVVGINTPHTSRAWADPIQTAARRFGDQMYIVQFQGSGREPDRIFGDRVEQTFDPSCASRRRVPTLRPQEVVAGVGASSLINLAFPANDCRL